MEVFLCIFGFCVVCWMIYAGFKTDQEKKQNRYNLALRELDAKNFDEAISGFSALSGFRDSDKKLRWVKELKYGSMLESIRSDVSRFDGGARRLLGFEDSISVKRIANLTISSTAHVKQEFNICRTCHESAKEKLEIIAPLAQELDYDVGELASRLTMEERLLPFLEYYGNALQSTMGLCIICNPVDDYGKANEWFLAAVNRLDLSVALRAIRCIQQASSSTVNLRDYAVLCSFDPLWLVGIAWKVALSKPFRSEEFEQITKISNRAFRMECGDSGCFEVALAKLYAQYSIAGEDIICSSLRKHLEKEQLDESKCAPLASFFMWIGACSAEAMVLEHMLANNVGMSPKMQERLRTLKRGEGQSMRPHQVEPASDLLYFDTASIGWNVDSLRSLFANLQFHEKSLSYALALREEESSLTLPSNKTVPTINIIESNIHDFLYNEYADEISVSTVQAKVMSRNSEEQLDGILIRTKVCAYLGILVLIIPIGKRLTVKQYTLYMPTNRATNIQKADAESLIEQTSPITKVWETSLKQNSLGAIEIALNEVDTPTFSQPKHRPLVEEEVVF